MALRRNTGDAWGMNGIVSSAAPGSCAIRALYSYWARFWQILQLYVASYQAPGIWKEAWKHLVSVISVQIIRDVEAFVARHPFADADVMRFVVAS